MYRGRERQRMFGEIEDNARCKGKKVQIEKSLDSAVQSLDFIL